MELAYWRASDEEPGRLKMWKQIKCCDARDQACLDAAPGHDHDVANTMNDTAI